MFVCKVTNRGVQAVLSYQIWDPIVPAGALVGAACGSGPLHSLQRILTGDGSQGVLISFFPSSQRVVATSSTPPTAAAFFLACSAAEDWAEGGAEITARKLQPSGKWLRGRSFPNKNAVHLSGSRTMPCHYGGFYTHVFVYMVEG